MLKYSMLAKGIEKGGVLHRTKTLAAGDDCCDFHVTQA